MFKINQLKWNTKEESSLSINDLKKNSLHSTFFRNLLLSNGYKKFDGKKLKGNYCYDAYYKDFEENKELSYTVYCYCYDLKNVVENPELLEFSFEVQIDTERGILSFESIQWDFTKANYAKENLKYFESKCEEIWKVFGSKKFPE
jgi:hypothetical protein